MSALPSLTIEKDLQPSLQEEVYVHDVYNAIAPHFSQTRYKPWPIVESFLKSRPKYSIGIDVGCGNGKYLNVSEDLFIIGTDRSSGLIHCGQEISKNKYNLSIADGLSLPHPNNTFDFAISIAVIHHFANENRRIEAIQHILSKLRQNGQCLIYCWALEQESSRRGYKEGDEQDILIPWVLQKKQKKKARNSKNKTSKTNNHEKNSPDTILDDIEPQPEEEVETKYRYYHLYKKGELAQNALATKSCKIIEEGYEKDNWWVILEKI
ncbi:TRM9 [Candida pseudojiufengensis]|uniref:TRM9 n=1 Tax=Candida pseudojiufengensis TaxID=497109 RepID=UPI0022244F5B|nr:TRM9 [Candida pseudojiufengensis]KAI5962592.1 TRM9 [Candida pseudojiufengensis]